MRRERTIARRHRINGTLMVFGNECRTFTAQVSRLIALRLLSCCAMCSTISPTNATIMLLHDAAATALPAVHVKPGLPSSPWRLWTKATTYYLINSPAG